MRIAAAIVFIVTTTILHADPMRPVEMVHTATGTRVLVACYDIPAQMGNADTGDRNLLLVVRKSAWENADGADKRTLRRAVTRLLNRSYRLTPARMQAIKQSLKGAGARIVRTNDPRATLAARGIASIGD